MAKYGREMVDKYWNDEIPRHRVSLTHGFWLCRTEVTVGQFRKFSESAKYRTEAELGDGATVFAGGKWDRRAGTSWKAPGFAQGENHPVTCVSWNDAAAFCRWVSEKTGEAFRLPTEAKAPAASGLESAFQWLHPSGAAFQGRDSRESGLERSPPRWRPVSKLSRKAHETPGPAQAEARATVWVVARASARAGKRVGRVAALEGGPTGGSCCELSP